jgi:hypothetical protein
MPNRPPPGPQPAPLPGWLGPVVQLTTQVGIPTVFAAVLLWFVLFRLDTALKVIEQSENARVAIIRAVQETLTDHMDRQGDVFERVMRENIKANQENADRIERLFAGRSGRAKEHPGGGTEPPP